MRRESLLSSGRDCGERPEGEPRRRRVIGRERDRRRAQPVRLGRRERGVLPPHQHAHRAVCGHGLLPKVLRRPACGEIGARRQSPVRAGKDDEVGCRDVVAHHRALSRCLQHRSGCGLPIEGFPRCPCCQFHAAGIDLGRLTGPAGQDDLPRSLFRPPRAGMVCPPRRAEGCRAGPDERGRSTSRANGRDWPRRSCRERGRLRGLVVDFFARRRRPLPRLLPVWLPVWLP